LKKYFKTIDGRSWRFATEVENGLVLKLHTETQIKRFVKVQNSRSPYDGDWVYWSKRMGKNPMISKSIATLIKKQKGKCPQCNHNFQPHDLLEIDHIIPKSKGGKNTYENLQLMHRHCHDNKTARDGSNEKY
jgi:RNA-directed DNA polymerase